MRTFFTFRTQIVFAYFSKKWQFYKQIKSSSQPPKNTIFLGFFLKFSLSMFFMFCLFLFPTWKRQKQKVHIFFRKPFFWHLDKLPKNYFRTPTHYLCFLRYPQNTIKLGKNKQKKVLDQVLTQPWTKLWLKNPKSWTKFWLYSIYAVESKLGPKIAFFWVKTWSKFSLVFLSLFFKNLLLSAGRMRF